MWIILEGKVYDMSKYEHPGGQQVLKEFAGGAKDGWEAFEDQGHTKVAVAQMKKLHIGSVSGKDTGVAKKQQQEMEFVLNDFQGLSLKFIIFVSYAGLFYSLMQ